MRLDSPFALVEPQDIQDIFSSSPPRTVISRAPPQHGSLLQKFYAPRHHQLLYCHKVRSAFPFAWRCMYSSCSPIDRTDFLITTSVDGHLKLWKKQESGIEFVKHYRAHLMPVIGVSASADGQLFASISEDGTAKVFDVVNFGELGLASSSALIPDCNLRRYDNYYQPWIYSSCLLLGSSTRTGPSSSCNVRPFFCVLVVVITTQ